MDTNRLRDYLLDISSSRTGRNLIKKNQLPIRKIKVNFTPLTKEKHGEFAEFFGEKNFDKLYQGILNFPKIWVQLNSNVILEETCIGQLEDLLPKKGIKLVEKLIGYLNCEELSIKKEEFYKPFLGEQYKNIKDTEIHYLHCELNKSLKDWGRIEIPFLDYENPLKLDILRKDLSFSS